MSLFTKTLIVDGEGGGLSQVSNFTEETNGWNIQQGSSWSFANNTATATTFGGESYIESKQDVSFPAGSVFILKYYVNSVDPTTVGVLHFSMPNQNPVISKAVGLHVYKFTQESLATGKIRFTYGGPSSGYSIQLSKFSFKLKGEDGTYIALKTAVDDLGTDGGSVIVEQGEYPINGISGEELTTISVPSNCCIAGQGNSIITVKGNVPVFQNNNQSIVNERINISGLTIKINMPGLEQYSSNAIEMKNVKYSVFENMKISKSSGSILGTKSAIHIDATTTSGSLGNIISQCDIAHFGNGIYLGENSCENQITGNSIHECLSQNIYLFNSNNNIVLSNMIYQCGGDGLRISNSNYTIVHENQIYLNTSCGIFVINSDGCTFSGNNCSQNKKSGIVLQDVNNSNVSSNICYGNGTNTEDEFTRSGINILNVGYTSFVSNICFNNGMYGIREGLDHTPAPSKGLYIGNICTDNSEENISYCQHFSTADHNITNNAQ